jgi:formylglycine-generating enzyme required for sulfatase activity
MHQIRWAEYLRVPVVQANSIGMKLVLVPPGEFLMGAADSEKDAEGEKPQPPHRVRITKPFYLGVYLVTQAEYERVMQAKPSHFAPEPKRPVDQVSWGDAEEFCQKLSALPEEKALGRVYRLPTEAQWEYACRAGTTTRWSCGDDENRLRDYAWTVENSGHQTHPVGQKMPNPWGLYDMHGNVFEWCQDWFDEGYYWISPLADPTGPATGSRRVCRGSDWAYIAKLARSGRRDKH